MSTHVQLAVIGGGTAGLAAVMTALDLNVESVALIESNAVLGGECALNACVPTKVLLTAAKYRQQILYKAQTFGLAVETCPLDFSKLMATVDYVIRDGDYGFMSDERVLRIRGRASFVDPETLMIAETGQQITADKIIIAAGAMPRALEVPGIEDVGYMTFQQATHLKTLPESIAIVGGGPVGVEFAYMFSAFGSAVHLLHRGDAILPHEEPEIQQAMTALLSAMGVRIHTGTTLTGVGKINGNRVRVTFDQAGGEIGQVESVEVETILSAIGMHPRLESLALENGDIHYSHEEGIQVTPQLQTTNPRVWAVGDIIQHYEFTHIADYQAELAVSNALLEQDEPVQYKGIGWCIFTSPSIAHVGLGEAQAREQYPEVDVIEVQADEVSRYRIEAETFGFIKLIVNAQSHLLLGAHIMAAESEDMIHVLMLAIRECIPCETLLHNMIYIYPTRAQLIQKALEKYMRTTLKKTRPVYAKSG